MRVCKLESTSSLETPLPKAAGRFLNQLGMRSAPLATCGSPGSTRPRQVPWGTGSARPKYETRACHGGRAPLRRLPFRRDTAVRDRARETVVEQYVPRPRLSTGDGLDTDRPPRIRPAYWAVCSHMLPCDWRPGPPRRLGRAARSNATRTFHRRRAPSSRPCRQSA